MGSVKHYPPEGFTKRLHESVLKSGLEITLISKVTGIPRTSVYEYVINGVVPNVTALAKLCKILHVSADYLLFGEEVKKCNI